MLSLTFILFQRAALILVAAFALTRIRAIRRLFDRRWTWRASWFGAVFFGLFGMVATQFDVEWLATGATPHGLVVHLAPDAMLVGPSSVVLVIAGLLGGPVVGLFAGLVTGTWVCFLGGDAVLANLLFYPMSAVFSGLIARFLSRDHVIAPPKAMFVGMFVPILHMGLLLICSGDSVRAITLVNTIGLPIVVANSVAIAIFTAILRVALAEQEQEAAQGTQRALRIAEAALPYLRQSFNAESAEKLAWLLIRELKIAAVSVTNCERVLAHVGLGQDHHQPGQTLRMRLAWAALETGELQVAHERGVIQCNHPGCPLDSAIMVPLRQSGEVVGLINLYFPRGQAMGSVEIELARGLGQLMSKQLDVVAAVNLKELIQDARLRNLQAQVNPHFLFNTLHMISALIRINPDHARHIVAQLGQFMRHNLRITQQTRIPMEQEVEHLRAYIEIVKARFADHLQIDLQVDPVAKFAEIPPCTLQPLVENSIKHGFSGRRGVGMISVKIQPTEGWLNVDVTDNGRGVDPDLLEHLGKRPMANGENSGVGLYNVNQRLVRVFGSTSEMTIVNAEGGGCRVTFRVPRQEGVGELA